MKSSSELRKSTSSDNQVNSNESTNVSYYNGEIIDSKSDEELLLNYEYMQGKR